MTRDEKSQVVKYLGDEFSSSEAIIICNYNGVGVPALESLRTNAREKNAKVQVAKNSLASLAFKKSGVKDLNLSGTNIFLWSEDQISLSKVAVEFSKNNETFEVKSAVIENEMVDTAMVESLSKLPGKEELLGMLLSVWTAPARNFVTGLDNLRVKKEEEQ
jgi:large subunit ribosomal protein L10